MYSQLSALLFAAKIGVYTRVYERAIVYNLQVRSRRLNV
jgi:hypothetical protein